MGKPKYVVVVRRENGRLHEEITANSKYSAKVKARQARQKYDHTYRVEAPRKVG